MICKDTNLCLNKELSQYSRNVISSPDEEFEEVVGVRRKGFNKLVIKWHDETLSHFGRPYLLSPIEQVFILFLHLRHYPANLLSAKIFGTSRQTIANTITLLLIHFDNTLKHNITFGDYASRVLEGKRWFNSIITFVLDGTEQKIHSSANIFTESNFFSTKKQQHSVTLLIIISPTGRILFISECFYGSIVDFELVIRTMFGWVPKLTILDGGAGDSGFRGLRPYGVNIYTPTTAHKTPIYKEFSRIRIKVENKIATLKIFEALHAEIREPILNNPRMLEMHSRKWRVVGALDVAKINDYDTLYFMSR